MKFLIKPRFLQFLRWPVVGLLAATLFLLPGCKKKVGPTQILIPDSVRHYYPMVLGEELDLVYEVKNVGEEPLLINDIQPSCGCIVQDKDNDLIIFPGKTAKLKFVFDSSKNIGFVDHTIRVYGNILPNGVAELKFDVNVVPPSENTPDYEETYSQKQRENRSRGLKEAVDGTSSQKGYMIDKDGKTDSRSHSRYPWRE